MKKIFRVLLMVGIVTLLMIGSVSANSHTVIYEFDGRITGELRYYTGDTKTATLIEGRGSGVIKSSAAVEGITIVNEFFAEIQSDTSMTLTRAIKTAIEADGDTSQIHAVRLSAYLGNMLAMEQTYLANEAMLQISTETYTPFGRLDRRMDISWLKNEIPIYFFEDVSIFGMSHVVEFLDIHGDVIGEVSDLTNAE